MPPPTRCPASSGVPVVSVPPTYQTPPRPRSPLSPSGDAGSPSSRFPAWGNRRRSKGCHRAHRSPIPRYHHVLAYPESTAYERGGCPPPPIAESPPCAPPRIPPAGHAASSPTWDAVPPPASDRPRRSAGYGRAGPPRGRPPNRHPHLGGPPYAERSGVPPPRRKRSQGPLSLWGGDTRVAPRRQDAA